MKVRCHSGLYFHLSVYYRRYAAGADTYTGCVAVDTTATASAATMGAAVSRPGAADAGASPTSSVAPDSHRCAADHSRCDRHPPISYTFAVTTHACNDECMASCVSRPAHLHLSSGGVDHALYLVRLQMHDLNILFVFVP